ncbi:MAG: class I SAM-dependent methyltransferase [Desulfobulbaceae bacterium]|nr:class I SAM-dependent methyltransferase [Desulfobulbaceae bacterium]
MLYSKLRKFASYIRKTPLHPQWLMNVENPLGKKQIGKKVDKGFHLDIGCADQSLQNFISPEATYIGIDYLTTASKLYKTKPLVYADAQALPFLSASIDIVTLLDVLEHIPDAPLALAEAFRVLKPRGRAILSVPFLYPIHDAPFDFQRWTSHGLKKMAEDCGFFIEKEIAVGNPSQSAALIACIAAVRNTLELLKSYNFIGLILLCVLPLFIPIVNISGWALGKVSGQDNIMPFSYNFFLVKPESAGKEALDSTF